MKNVWMVFLFWRESQRTKVNFLWLSLSVGGTKIHKIHFRMEQKIYWPYVNVVFLYTDPSVFDQESPDLINRRDFCPDRRRDIASNPS